MFTAIYHQDLLQLLYFPLVLAKVRHLRYTCAMLRAKRPRCALLPPSKSDEVFCRFLVSRHCYSAHYWTFLLCIFLQLYNFYLKFRKLLHSEKNREKITDNTASAIESIEKASRRVHLMTSHAPIWRIKKFGCEVAL